MTREDAIDLIGQYCKMWDNKVSRKAYQLVQDPDMIGGLRSRWPEDGSERKAMRWLGFMQGALWTLGIYTLDELKEHSRIREVAEPTGDALDGIERPSDLDDLARYVKGNHISEVKIDAPALLSYVTKLERALRVSQSPAQPGKDDPESK